MKALVEKSITDADEFIDEDYIEIPFVAKNVDNKLDIVAYSDKNPTHVCTQSDVNAEFSEVSNNITINFLEHVVTTDFATKNPMLQQLGATVIVLDSCADFIIVHADDLAIPFSYVQPYFLEVEDNMLYFEKNGCNGYMLEFERVVDHKFRMMQSLFSIFVINNSSRILIFSLVSGDRINKHSTNHSVKNEVYYIKLKKINFDVWPD